MYKKGYTYTMTKKGANYEVHLKATEKKGISEMYIVINQKSYTPSQIRMKQQKGWTTIDIKNFKKANDDAGHSIIRISLKYDEKNQSVIHGVERISTPGRRVYSGYKDMPRVYNGYGTIIVSTSSGVTTGKKASEKMIGGELLCNVW
jgi:ribosomal protein S8